MSNSGPGPLPGESAGSGGADEVRDWLLRWLTSPALAALVAACGWQLVDGGLEARLAQLVGLSVAWDFRAGAERHLLSERPARVHGRELDETFVEEVATALGLSGGMPPTGTFTHAVVLCGMVRACLNRTVLAQELAGQLGVGELVLLSAHRPLGGAEADHAAEFGWGELRLESEAALAAARTVLGVRGLPDVDDSFGKATGGATANAAEAEQARRRAWFDRVWLRPHHVEVVAAPSGDPGVRRADTVDQLTFWSARAGISASDRLLLVTTEHYVPYQHLIALRVLGLNRRCGLVTVGAPWQPAGAFRGAGYLQEIRSTLLAMQDLIAVLDG